MDRVRMSKLIGHCCAAVKTSGVTPDPIDRPMTIKHKSRKVIGTKRGLLRIAMAKMLTIKAGPMRNGAGKCSIKAKAAPMQPSVRVKAKLLA